VNRRRERQLNRQRRDAAVEEKKRSCGECFACCVTHAVVAIAKAAYEPCPRLRASDDADAGRCSEYADRPEPCRTYACDWRRGGLLPHERPDRVGVVITQLAALNEVEAAEVRPGGFAEACSLLGRLTALGATVHLKPHRRHLPVVG